MEIYPMKSQISFIAIGLVAATAALGFATVGRLPATSPHLTAPVRVADSTTPGAPPHVYCYSGIKGGQDSLYRGWVCVPQKPTLTN
jgi:hypothetical protein